MGVVKSNLQLLFCQKALLQHNERLGPHVKEEIDDAEIGQEAEALLEDLVIGHGTEGGIGLVEGELGMDAFAVILNALRSLRLIEGASNHLRMQVDKVANQLHQRLVVIHQEGVAFLFVEGGEVVAIVLEIGGVVVG